MTTTDELAIKLYGLVDTERLAEAKRNGNALEYFIRIAREIEQPTPSLRVPPIREDPRAPVVPERRVRESELETRRIGERRTPSRRSTSPSTSVDEGVRVSPL